MENIALEILDTEYSSLEMRAAISAVLSKYPTEVSRVLGLLSHESWKTGSANRFIQQTYAGGYCLVCRYSASSKFNRASPRATLLYHKEDHPLEKTDFYEGVVREVFYMPQSRLIEALKEQKTKSK